MLYINPNSKEVTKALSEHYQAIKCFIRKKIGQNKKCNDPDCKICDSNIESIEAIPLKLKEYLLLDNVLKDLICGSPNELVELNDYLLSEIFGNYIFTTILKSLNKKKKDQTKEDEFFISYYHQKLEILSRVFDYNRWFIKLRPTSQYSAYHLAKNLNRSTCTYCNRIYTNTMLTSKGGKLMRPQFDHWFPKSRYPLLALSFYNLIPSCSICNSSSKGDKELYLNKHVHPYIDVNQTRNFEFNYEFDEKLDSYNISIQSLNGCLKSKDTLEELNVHTMYNAHHSELKDLIKLREAYSEDYIEKIQELFKDSHLSKQEIYRILFGTELDEQDFHKRPMSKFKHDILKELDII